MHDESADILIIGSDTERGPSGNRKRKRGVRVTTAAAAALGLAVFGGAVAGAATTTTSPPSMSASAPHSGLPPSGSPPAVVGTVKSVGDGTFTITSQDGTTVTVDVGSSTTYRDPGVTSPTIANVTVGEHVAVFGTDTSNTVTATSVAIGTPPSGGMGGPGPRGSRGTPPAGSAGAPPSA